MIDMSRLVNSVMNNQKAMSNPAFQNAYRMLQSKDEQGLKNLAENLCREKGIDINQLIDKLKR